MKKLNLKKSKIVLVWSCIIAALWYNKCFCLDKYF